MAWARLYDGNLCHVCGWNDVSVCLRVVGRQVQGYSSYDTADPSIHPSTTTTITIIIRYILVNGTVGGIAMDVPFALYGVTFAVCAAMAWYHARQKNWAQHRAWALRLFSQGIGSAL